MGLNIPSKIVELLNRLTESRVSKLENLDAKLSDLLDKLTLLDAKLTMLRNGYDSLLYAFKTFPFEAISPVDEINLYAEIPSDSAEDTILQVISGTGTDTWMTKHVQDNHIAWIESIGLEAEFSTPTPNISWNITSAKYIRLQRKYYDRQGNPVTSEAVWGGSTTNEQWNWRNLIALSEQLHYVTGFASTQKDHFRADFIAAGNLHYWFLNQKGDEYIKLAADAGIFTYTNDVPTIYIHGMIFDLADLQNAV